MSGSAQDFLAARASIDLRKIVAIVAIAQAWSRAIGPGIFSLPAHQCRPLSLLAMSPPDGLAGLSREPSHRPVQFPKEIELVLAAFEAEPFLFLASEK